MTPPAGLLTQRQAAALIGRSHRFIAKLEAEGLLTPLPGTTCPKLYRRRDLGPWLPEDALVGADAVNKARTTITLKED